MTNIPFNNPYVTGRELAYIREVIESGKTAAGGRFTERSEALIRQHTGASNVLLTNSCTAALEMAAILVGTGPDDEIIMPSFTFPSTANAFLLRGARPVFVDIRHDTLNIDETLIEAAITPRTKAIIAVHYAGIPCEMNTIMAIAKKHDLFVIEDAAQAFLSTYKGKSAGTIGHLGTFSFHATKNIHCGEGGALLVNHSEFLETAEILREKGTNRKDFLAGKVEKYTWSGIGTSSSVGELAAAYLCAQLEDAREITAKRAVHWNAYDAALKGLRTNGDISTPFIPPTAQHNSHIYYVLFSSREKRDDIVKAGKSAGIECTSHYEPLHLSPEGLLYSREPSLPNSTALPGRVLRLPLWPGLPENCIQTMTAIIGNRQ
ncbi:MAG: dTDP-4-amino-4,6-dideoxygalactose transaminase [Moraxellaceae bacterium]|nr:dTDP-4-amino-4,6-dideoxygalactose transaminase [Moraxellaceae bacterium]